MKDTYYRHRDGRLMRETVSVGDTEAYSLLYLYTGGTLTGLVYLGADGTKTQYMLEHDLMGNVVAILRSTSFTQTEVVATYDYDAFGNHAVYDGEGNVNTDEDFIGNLNPFRYKGYYYDADTGLYHLNAREYDPYYGRFISPDSLKYQDPYAPAGLGLYAYCNGDPVNYADPSGCMPQWAKWAVVGLAVAGLAVATALTLGATGPVAAVGSAMLIGGFVSGGVNAIDQWHDTGTIDLTEVAISTLSGIAYGLVVGATGGTGGWAIAGKFAVAGGTSLLNSWNEEATFGETIKSLGISLAISGATQGIGYLAGKHGPQLLSKFLKTQNKSLTKASVISELWAKPAVKVGTMRLFGGIAGAVFNDIF